VFGTSLRFLACRSLGKPEIVRRESKSLLWVLAVCVFAVVQFIRYRGSDNWPTAVATVEKIEVRRVQDNDGHHFLPIVSFSFVVAEEYHSGEWAEPVAHFRILSGFLK
jgi:hypothetical protein